MHPIGSPVVRKNAEHAASSLHRTNVHFEFNGGLRRGYSRRWANLGCENVNRHTNRNGFKQKGWCNLETALIRSETTMIGKNFESLKCEAVCTRLEADQRTILRRLQDVERQCRNLTDLHSTLHCASVRRGFAPKLQVPNAEWKELMACRIKQYMLQFAAEHEKRDFDDNGSIEDWLRRRMREDDDWNLSVDELLRCRDELYAQNGISVHAETLRQRFAAMGHDVAGGEEQIDELIDEIED